MAELISSCLKDILARVSRRGRRREVELLDVCQYPEVMRLIVKHLNLESVLQLELVCRQVRRLLVSERTYRELVSEGIRSGQLVDGGWGWTRRRPSLLHTPTPEEASAYFKRRLVAHLNQLKEAGCS